MAALVRSVAAPLVDCSVLDLFHTGLVLYVYIVWVLFC